MLEITSEVTSRACGKIRVNFQRHGGEDWRGGGGKSDRRMIYKSWRGGLEREREGREERWAHD